MNKFEKIEQLLEAIGRVNQIAAQVESVVPYLQYYHVLSEKPDAADRFLNALSAFDTLGDHMDRLSTDVATPGWEEKILVQYNEQGEPEYRDIKDITLSDERFAELYQAYSMNARPRSTLN